MENKLNLHSEWWKCVRKNYPRAGHKYFICFRFQPELKIWRIAGHESNRFAKNVSNLILSLSAWDEFTKTFHPKNLKRFCSKRENVSRSSELCSIVSPLLNLWRLKQQEKFIKKHEYPCESVFHSSVFVVILFDYKIHKYTKIFCSTPKCFLRHVVSKAFFPL